MRFYSSKQLLLGNVVGLFVVYIVFKIVLYIHGLAMQQSQNELDFSVTKWVKL